jgi:hypothetical protein
MKNHQDIRKPFSTAPSLTERIPNHVFFVNRNAISKSKMMNHQLEFLHQVFSSEGASRFFITFLMRFMQDNNGSSDDSSGRMLALATL